jgi:hypothetical protein
MLSGRLAEGLRDAREGKRVGLYPKVRRTQC